MLLDQNRQDKNILEFSVDEWCVGVCLWLFTISKSSYNDSSFIIHSYGLLHM